MVNVIAFVQANGEAGILRPMYSERRMIDDPELGEERPETDAEVVARCMGNLPDGATNARAVDEVALPQPFDHVWNDGAQAWELTVPAAERAARQELIGYRTLRENGFHIELRDVPENTPFQTMGDCIDVLFHDAQQRREAGETLHPALVVKLDKWLAVKSAHPKPPDPPPAE
ncbi:MAG TPA: hypothetical protein EYP07_05675 [Kiloniellaceae bacterium]|nr:hypothetical protein [Kiloniellaceae bacterium]